ncbi:MAG: metallophosphoesterase [Sedimenticola sp.]
MMFGTILITVASLMHLYVCWRTWSVPVIKRRFSRAIFITTSALLWVAFVIGRMYGHDSHGQLATLLELFSMTWLGTLLLMTVTLLAVDIATGFGLFMSRQIMRLRGLALLVGIALTVTALIQGIRPPVIQDYNVQIAELPAEREGTSIVVLSDMHLGSLLGREWLEARVNQTLALQPDLVLLLGDIFEGHGPPNRELLPILQRLSAPMGVWAILGNHEFHSDPDTITDFMAEMGFEVLRNRWAEPAPGLIVAAVENPTYSRIEDKDGESIIKVLAGQPPGTTILLSHAPRHYEAAARAGVDLMLSGHTHSGQIWPFGYLVQQVFPLYQGRHEVKEMTLIISRGTGTWGPRMRLWHPAEIVRITLHR